MTDSSRSHVTTVRHADCYVIRCGHCGEQMRVGLPLLDSELRRLVAEFEAGHLHQEPPPALEVRGEGIHITCWNCGNEDQGRFRHVCDEHEPGAVETTFECLDCETLISDWFEVEDEADE